MLGKTEGRRGQKRMRWLDNITDSMDMNVSKLRETVRTGNPGVLQSTGSKRVGHNLVTTTTTMPTKQLNMSLEIRGRIGTKDTQTDISSSIESGI